MSKGLNQLGVMSLALMGASRDHAGVESKHHTKDPKKLAKVRAKRKAKRKAR